MKNPMFSLLKKALLAITFISIVSTTYARRFYVSSTYTGSTSNGSINTPWKSLANVQSNMSLFVAGDTISFKCNETFVGTLNITRSGVSGQPIVFNSYGIGEKPKLTGTGSIIDYLIQSNSNYLVIDGFQVIDPALTDTGRTEIANIRRAITFRGGYCIAKNNEISRAGIGLYVSQGHHCTFDNNIIHHLKMIVNDVTSPDNDYGGAPIWLAGNDNIVIKNTCYSNWGVSYDYGVDGGGFEFFDEGIGAKNNFLAYNTMYENDGIIETSYSGSCDSNTLAYNKFINNSSLAYFQDNCSGWNFYNNTIVETQLLLYSTPKTIFSGRAGNTSQMVFKNNVFYITTGSSIVNTARFSSYVHSNNIFRLSGNSTAGFTLNSTEQTTNTAFWTNTSSSNPAFWNYSPISGGVLINSGVNVGLTSDFGGNVVASIPEIGVFEESTAASSNLQATATASVISCFGGTSSVLLTATGGTAPYIGTGTYTVSAGVHTFTVTDASGSTDTVTVNIMQPAVINVSISSGTISTPGGTTSIQVNASGGTGSFQYALNGGSYQSSNIFNNVAAGNHTVNVKDANGCIMPKSFTITAPVVTSLSVSATAGNIACSGGTTTVMVSASGGVTPYTGIGSYTVVAGSYTYTVTDAAGTSQTATVSVTQPAALTLSLTSGTIASYGGTTSITAASAGGTGSKTYRLNNGTYQTSNIFSGVPAGIHTLMVKDANNCTQSASITISQPLPPTLNIQAVAGNIACNGGSTTVTVTATGGVAPYSGTGSFTVTAGAYTYTVTDNSGASSSTTINVGQPATLSVSAVSGVISAPGGSTSISATAAGGVSPYTFKLNGGSYQSASIFTGVLAGNHTITVRDVNGCTKSTALSITEPAANLASNIIAGSIPCYGGTTTVSVTASGGTPPYSGIGNFTVGAGTYSYTVTDANGASQTSSITVTQPAYINVSVSSGTISTIGGTTSLTVIATGGTPPFTYILDNTGYQTTNIFNSVGAGYHAVTVKDANGCIGTGNITIAEVNTNPLVVNVLPGTISCYGGTTMVNVSATGGVAPYSGIGNFSAGAGTRNYTVVDAAGQTSTVSITIVQPAELVATATPVGDIATVGGTTTVAVSASGGTPTYKYSLDGGPFQTGSTFRSVGAGAHYVTVMDANSCVKVVTFTVGQLESSGFVLNLLGKSDVTCRGGSDGKIEVQASGGRAPYQYAIGNGLFSINNRFFNLRAGIYRVKAKDANGNIAEIIVSIQDGRRRCSGRTTAREGEQLTIAINAFPNPSTSRFNVTVDPVTDELIRIEVMDAFGKKVYQDIGDPEKEFHFGEQLKAGIYFLRATQGSLSTTTKLVKM